MTAGHLSWGNSLCKDFVTGYNSPTFRPADNAGMIHLKAQGNNQACRAQLALTA
jgi:hypothetical protein